MRTSEDVLLLLLTEEHILRLVHLGGHVVRTAAVRVVRDHELVFVWPGGEREHATTSAHTAPKKKNSMRNKIYGVLRLLLSFMIKI